MDDILAAQAHVDATLGPLDLGVRVSPFYPVTGNRVLPDDPLPALRSGRSGDVPLLIGTNRDETTLWQTGEPDSGRLERTARELGDVSLLDVYRATRPGLSSRDLMVAMTTDHTFRIPAIRLAEARAGQRASTWMYRFDWPSRAFDGRLKATHALEVPFAFDNLDRAGVDVFLGPGPTPQAVADEMHGAWTAFVRSADPGWPAYAAPERTTRIFDDVSRTVGDPDAAERQAWEGLR